MTKPNTGAAAKPAARGKGVKAEQPEAVAALGSAFERKPGARGSVGKEELAAMQGRAVAVLGRVLGELADAKGEATHWKARHDDFVTRSRADYQALVDQSTAEREAVTARRRSDTARRQKFDAGSFVLAQLVGVVPMSDGGRSMVEAAVSDSTAMAYRIYLDLTSIWIDYFVEMGAVQVHELDEAGEDHLSTISVKDGPRLSESDLDGLRAKLKALVAEHSRRRRHGGAQGLPREIVEFLEHVASAGHAQGSLQAYMVDQATGKLVPFGPNRG